MQASVSFVIPVLNEAHVLAQSVATIRAFLAGQPWESCVVVVDNGSTDDSLSVIARYGDRVRLVRQAVNIGQGQGYNLGIEATTGDVGTDALA